MLSEAGEFTGRGWCESPLPSKGVHEQSPEGLSYVYVMSMSFSYVYCHLIDSLSFSLVMSILFFFFYVYNRLNSKHNFLTLVCTKFSKIQTFLIPKHKSISYLCKSGFKKVRMSFPCELSMSRIYQYLSSMPC